MRTVPGDRRKSRRRFLKGLVVTGGTVGAGLVVGGTGPAPITGDDHTEPVAQPAAKQGYHETSHIRAYYELARF